MKIFKKIQQGHFYTKENFGKELLNSTKMSSVINNFKIFIGYGV